MVSTKNRAQANPALLKNIAKGVLASAIFIMLGSMLLTTFIVSGSLNENSLKLGTTVLLMLAAGIGSVLTGKSTGQKKLIAVVAYVSSVIILLLGVNLIFWDGEFENILYKIAAILAGGSFGVLGKGRASRKRRKIRNR